MLKESEILHFISEDKASKKKQLAKVGQRYYEAEHDILEYRMFYYNADGRLVEDKTRANMKIPHPFFTELIDQAVQYMLSGKNESGELKLVKSDNPKLQKRLDEYFDDDFISELSEVLTGTKSKGFDHMFAYANTEGRLAFQHADSMGVIEVKAKDTDDGCEYVIYWYTERISKEDKTIKKIEVWDSKQTHFYVQDGEGNLLKDKSQKINPRPHVIYKKDGDDSTYYEDFGFVPFFRLDNNKKQTSDLKPIKSLIDDYDIMSCGLSNNLADFDHPLHVVKGFKGDNLDELQMNLKTKKMVGIPSNEGGVEVHTVTIPHDARLAKMNEDEKNIYRFGMGFNSSQVGDGNVTNVVIKSRYALLDLKCNKFEIRLKQFLKKIVKVVLAEINKLDGTDYQMDDVYFDLKREIMTNATDNAQIEKIDAEKQQIQINTLLSLASVFDDETIIQNICDVIDLDYETIKGKLPKKDDDLTEEDDILNNVVPDDLGGDVIE